MKIREINIIKVFILAKFDFERIPVDRSIIQKPVTFLFLIFLIHPSIYLSANITL